MDLLWGQKVRLCLNDTVLLTRLSRSLQNVLETTAQLSHAQIAQKRSPGTCEGRPGGWVRVCDLVVGRGGG